jgi:hypothetical protein
MRFTFVILLFCCLGADAQMIIKAHANYRPYAVAVAQNLLLDDYPNAAAAYSLRKLDKDYTGNAIRVRRSNDNAEQDIGFVGNDLDTASLKTFVGANSGFVTTWYDQVGNIRNWGANNNQIQSTAANQPRIVNAGVVERDNGKPCVVFDGSNDRMRVAVSTTLGNENRVITDDDFSIFGIASGNAQSNTSVLSQHSSATGRIIFLNANASGVVNLFFNNGTSYSVASTTVAFNGTQKLLYSEMNGSGSSHVRVNGGNAEGTLNNQTLNPLNIGLQIGSAGDGSANFFNGKISEIVLYQPNQSSNRTGIENNINDYYNIYWNGDFAGLLDSFPSSAAAYSLRNLDKDYLGPLVRVRRSNDNAEQDIFGDYYGNLDTVGLKNFVGANSGFVTTWYDQSGNARNATQTTAANQPIIVSSGSILRTNNLPTIRMNDNTDFFVYSNALVFNYDYYYVKSTSDNQYILLNDNSNAGNYGYVAESGSTSTNIYSNFGTPTLYVNNVQFTGTTRNNVYTTYNNIVSLSSIINCSTNWSNVRISGFPFGFNYIGNISEFISYANSTGTNRTGVQNNINSYYGIY